MAKETQGVLAPIVDISVKLDKDDVAAILMSKAEEMLKQDIKGHQEEDKRLKKEIDASQKAIDKECKVVAETHFESTIETLTAAASSLKCKNVKAHTSHRGQTRDGVQVQMTLHGDKPSINWSVQTVAKKSADLKKLNTELTGLQKATVENEEAWFEARRKLADLPSMERRAKAAVAAERLKQSDEGLALLQTLESQADSGMKLLGIH